MLNERRETGIMERALELAAKGGKHTFPNPLVGAVILDRFEETAGEGWHSRCGAPHAEIKALESAGDRASGGTLFVSLEPCCHHGRTPPCTEAIIRAGIARVIVAMEDPNPEVSGEGIKQLRRSGVEVVSGRLAERAREQNRVYIHYIASGRSLLHLKLAMSLDGRTAAADGSSRWLTGTESRRRVHLMRKAAAAVMVGAETFRADNPVLSARNVDCSESEQPARIIVTRKGRLDFSKKHVEGRSRLIVAVPDSADASIIHGLKDSGAEIWQLPFNAPDIDMPTLLERTALEGMGLVLCEGGSRLATSLLRSRLVDRLSIFTAPLILGGEGISGFGRLGVDTIEKAVRLDGVSTEIIGFDCLTEGNVVYRAD